MADETMLGRPVWYELLTTDTSAAETFYTHVVGWTTKAFEGSPQPYKTWHRADGTPIGGLMTIPPGMTFPPHWEMYLAVPDLDESIARIERLGGGSLSPIIDIPGVGRMRTMTDPQGAVFAIHQPASAPDPEAEPTTGDASWHELYTTDAPAAMTFYQEAFGWRPTSSFDMGPMGTYYMFGRGRTWDLGGMMTKTKEMAHLPSAWSIYFRVDDVHAGAKRITADGGQVINGPMEVPGGDWIVNGVDPQGAHFSLHSKRAS